MLLIDFDTQGQVARALGVNPENGLANVLLDELAPEDAVAPARNQLWILAGGQRLAGAKRLIARKEFGGEMTVSEALEPLADQYDYVILDTAPGWDALTINALFYASEVLTPVSLEVLALQGLAQFHKSVKKIQALRGFVG